ncbi:MATE family efflux transporter [Undibacterium sp. TJN25]|uniref:MATE family efflux transporter n=1 Tax=Undibacterium sp. TJN25 TaxID=3413056 RepID=UPI003BF1D3C5
MKTSTAMPSSIASIPARHPPPAPPLWKTYLSILIPMVLTNFLQAASGTFNGIYIGQLLGVDAVAAVSAFFPVFFFFLAIIIGLSAGATVLAAHAWGAQDAARARAIAGTALALMLCVGLTTAALGYAFAPWLMLALGTPDRILADAVLYARLALLGTPLTFLLWLTTSMSRGVDDAVTPLKTLALATVISLASTPALIQGWWILPQLGVAGAAVSNMLAFALAMAWMFWHWRRKAHPLAPDAALLRLIRIDPAIAKKILTIGVPASLQMLTMAVAEIVLLRLVNQHGPDATAAYGAVNQVMSWIQLPAMSLGITASILASHAIGAGRSHRLPAIAHTGLRLNLVVTGAFVAAAYLLAPLVVGLFLTQAPVVALALNLLHIVAWSVLALGMGNVLVGVMRASGTVFGPMVLGMFAIMCIEVPAAYWLDGKIGITGIWWAYALAFISMLVLYSAYYRLVWRRDVQPMA